MERQLKIIAYILARICYDQERRMGISDSINEILETAESLFPETKSESKAKRFVPPTVEEVAAYCKERNNGIDPVAFVSHYAANGWMRGKTKMKDWKQAIITWEKHHNEKSGSDIRQVGKGCYYGEASL